MMTGFCHADACRQLLHHQSPAFITGDAEAPFSMTDRSAYHLTFQNWTKQQSLRTYNAPKYNAQINHPQKAYLCGNAKRYTTEKETSIHYNSIINTPAWR